MNKSKAFLEFVKNNPPPCYPGDRLFWFDCESGGIMQDTNEVSALIINDDWEWKIVDEDTGNLVTPNEDSYFCVTAEDAKKFRDKVVNVKYVVFKLDPEGKVVVNNKTYSFLKADILTDISSLGVDENYLSAILKRDSVVECGMIIKLEKHWCLPLDDEGYYDEYYPTYVDEESQRILEDVFGTKN